MNLINSTYTVIVVKLDVIKKFLHIILTAVDGLSGKKDSLLRGG